MRRSEGKERRRGRWEGVKGRKGGEGGGKE